MKNLLFFLILLLPLEINAQKVSEKILKKHREKVADSKKEGYVLLSLDTIFNKGVPYAILNVAKKESFIEDYSLKSLSGKELIYIRTDEIPDPQSATGKKYFYTFLFMQSGNKAEVSNFDIKDMETFIVDNDLVKDSIVNPESEKRFLMIHPPTISTSNRNSQTIIVIGSSNNYETVSRNRNADIEVWGTQVKQDFKLIGTFSKSTSSSNGDLIYTISYFLPNGTKVAEATGMGINAKQWKVLTLKDNQVHTVNTTYAEEEKQIAKYLSDLYYL